MLSDAFGRQFTYLRLSVTDVCNFRCQYCLPDGYQCDRTRNEMSLEEIGRVATAFTQLGIQKIRLTGGEPSIRRDLVEIIARLRALDGLKTIALTTNGYKLPQKVSGWVEAGLDALNVSVDSLDARLFQSLTGHNRLREVLEGIDKALSLGLKVKVNSVLLRGWNDHQLDQFLAWIKDTPISIRFIELMQTSDNLAYFKRHHVSGALVRDKLYTLGWREVARSPTSGPAVEMVHPDYAGRIGLIMPYSPDFCRRCNRLRISSEGNLHLCLFASEGHSLRHFMQNDAQLSQLKAQILALLQRKSEGHQLHQGRTGMTKQLAMIGG